MSEAYSVVMTGKMVEGMAPEQVKANVGKLFKVGDEQLAKMFSGKPVAVRRGVDRQQAEKISAALAKAGAVAVVKSTPPKAEKVPVSPSMAAEEPGQESNTVVDAAASNPEDSAQDLVCPRCGHEQSFATACGLCKMDLTLHIQRLKRKEQARLHRQQQASQAAS